MGKCRFNISLKTISLILGMVLGISILIPVCMGYYDRPSADDFSFAITTHQAWENTHNIFSVLTTAAEKSVNCWLTWTGDYTTNFLMALSPCIWGEKMYIITPIIMLGSLVFSILFLTKQVITKMLGYSKEWARIIAYIILIVLIQCMISPVEGFFWYNGSSKYMLLNSLMLIFYGLLIKTYYQAAVSKFQIALISIYAFIVAGGNQMTALNGLLVSLIMWGCFWKMLSTRRGNLRTLICPSVFYLIGFILNIAAPGNMSRASVSSGMNPIKAVMVALYDFFYYCVDRWTTWPVILMLVLLIPIFYRMFASSECQFSFRYPLIVVILGYLITSAMMAPPLFGTGNMEAGRLQNITYVTYILTLTISEGYIVGWISKHVSLTYGSKEFAKNELIMILTTIGIFVLASVLTVIPQPHYFTSSSATYDMINGTAKAYADSFDKRTEIFKSGEKGVTIDSFATYPYTVFFSDIKGEGNEWIRDAVCKYYNLESIEISE